MMISPIETEFNGYRFRSRLEAKWAVYFQLLRTKFNKTFLWEYEPEGYKSESQFYLPDFRITKKDPENEKNILQIFLEIKPINQAISDEIMDKGSMVTLATNDIFVILRGDAYDYFPPHVFKKTENELSEYWTNFPDFKNGFQMSKNLEILFLLLTPVNPSDWVEFFEREGNKLGAFLKMADPLLYSLKAAEEARKSRFEHGEKGERKLGK